MYTRPVNEMPDSFVRNGHPVFGSFIGHPKRLDIRGVFRPYGIVPLPTFITNLRIKSRISFFYNIGDYIGYIDFVDAKVIGYADVCFWNKNTKQKYSYRTIMGPRRRFVPHNLDMACTSCYKKSRYIRISWDRLHDRLSIIFNMKGKGIRPGANAAFIAKFSTADTADMTFNRPAPTMRRCSASYFLGQSLHGAITVLPKDKTPVTMEDAEGISFLDINRSYLRFRSHGEFVTGVGSVKGKNVIFRIAKSSQEAATPELYNDNVLFYEGKATPLPPVVITHPYGITNNWIIQDTEGMIDLTFTPVADNLNKISVFVLQTEYHTIYGTFEGALLTGDGEKITIKSLPGIAKNYHIRL